MASPQDSASPARTYSQGGAVMLLGAAVTVIGSVLPWAKASAPLVGTVSTAGTDGDGVITIGLGVLVGLCGLVAWKPTVHKAAVAWCLLAAVGISAVSIYDISNVSDAIKSAESRSTLITASVGAGLYVTIVGAIAAAVGALMKNAENNAATPSTPTAPLPLPGDTPSSDEPV